MAEFKYTGESPNGPFEMFGHTWENGTVNIVTDETAVRKLSGNCFFERIETEAPTVKRGRKKDKDHGDADTPATVSRGDGEAGAD
ncbi:MAG: hypothetical protein IPM06_18055 [Rhizobiales bacterium]|nr:hypothetical protein [Hyphomicrobiales bacterium]